MSIFLTDHCQFNIIFIRFYVGIFNFFLFLKANKDVNLNLNFLNEPNRKDFLSINMGLE